MLLVSADDFPDGRDGANKTMWVRHLLMFGVCCLGLTVVGSQLRKPELKLLEINEGPMLASSAIVQQLDDEFASFWYEQGIETAARADNLQVARRMSLALVGTVPSLEELRALNLVPPERQLDVWLRHLLSDRRFGDYVGERLARAYVGTEDGPFIVFRRRRFVSWLSDQLMENRPYDELVRMLISDRGTWTGSPAVNFITVTNSTNEKDQPDPARLAARTTRAFLGVRLDCMQCHDDNLGGDWKQSDFHQLAAFFAEARSSGLGIQDSEREYEYTYLHRDESEVIDPKVPFADDIVLPQLNRRQQLANWVTHPQNRAFARATVNRMWALLFAKPLVEPIDDISLKGPWPPGMETLANDFAENGFDLQRLIAQIVATRAFQLDSRADFEVTKRHEQAWAVFPVTRLRPEQVAGSIVQSASLSTIDSNSHVLLQFVASQQVGEFVQRYGDTGEDEFDDRGGTIPQRLLMLNGKLVKERTKDDLVANAATRIAQQVKDDSRAIDQAFTVVLTRLPSDSERKHFVEILADDSVGNDRAYRMEDIFWSLLNSAEFSWNH